MKKKYLFGFIDPQVIISVFVAMMIMAIGVFAVFTVIVNTQDENVGVGGTFTRTFSPSASPQYYTNLPDDTEDVTGVEEYYNGAWHTITEGTGWYYNATTNTLTVNATGW